ncbi:hypothetical protein D1872_289590 [compost metagenome]
MYSQLISEGFGNPRNRMFTCCVRRNEFTTLEGQHGSDVDDLTALLLNHDSSYRLAQEVYGVQVDLHNCIPILWLVLKQWSTTNCTRIVHQHINATIGIQTCLYYTVQSGLVCQVSLMERYLGACLLD